jgi:hypothetical protein
MMKFQAFQLWFLIPGVILTLTSVHVPVSYFHKQLFWNEAEALLGDRVERESGGVSEVLFKMEFVDEKGMKQHILTDLEDTYTEGKDSQHIRIYYDPANPEDHELVNHGRYLLILFLPFGLLCCYLGWPEKTEKRDRSSRS